MRTITITILLCFYCVFTHAQNVGIGTTTPIARLHVTDSNVVFTGPATIPVTTIYNPPIQGPGTRMLWYPQKGAFRAGYVDGTQWDKNNIGRYSFATGLNTLASGDGAFAHGAASAASSFHAIAIGYNTTASGQYSIAMGNIPSATGDNSIALGYLSTASAPFSTTIGRLNLASGYGATAIGVKDTASGFYTLAAGNQTTASADYATAMGNQTLASGQNSTAMGYSTTASGQNSIAIGVGATASAYNSTAMGSYTTASGNYSTITGLLTSAKSFCETTIGSNNTDYTPYSSTGWNVSDRLFVIGNGAASNATSDAMVVLKNGNTGIGISLPNAPLQFATSNQKRKIVLFETANNDNQFFGFGVFGGELRYQTGVNTDDHVFYSAASSIASTELMRIKGNGNVGIGTSAPNAPLQFSNNTANRKIVFYEAANNDHQFNGFGLNAGALRYQVNNTGDDHVFYAGTSATSSIELIRVRGNGNVGIGTSTPSARLHIADSNVVFTGPATVPATTAYNPPIQGAGTRMMWYPQKGAFRAGSVTGTQWDKNNIGRYSFAAGANAKASGDNSIVLGNNSGASGNNAIAFGVDNGALGDNSTAMGIDNLALSYAETVIGANNTAYGPLSTTSWNPADRLFVIGNGTAGNATSDAMVVLKNGNTGIGISVPTYKLHIGASNSGIRIEGPAAASSGGAAFAVGGYGEIQIDKVGTVGGRFIIKENGFVGIDKNNPAYKLDVTGDINASGNVRANGIALTSDERFKQNINNIPNALNNLLRLRGTDYFFNREAFPDKNFSANKQMGVIAQEVENIFPELVSTDKEGYKSVNYIGLIPVMIESIKTQQQQINELKQLVNKLISK